MAHPLSEDAGSAFLIPDHDYQVHSGTANNHGPTQILYYVGGNSVNKKLVATETITYDSNNFIATRRVVWENLPYL